MKYCPECEAEYKEEIQACADCETPLISAEEFLDRKRREQQERDSLSKEDFVSVKLAENAFEADRVRAALEQEGILIRYFDKPGLSDHIRISVGRPDQTDALMAALGRL